MLDKTNCTETRIIMQLRLDQTSGGLQLSLLLKAGSACSQTQVTQGFIKSRHENLQGWRETAQLGDFIQCLTLLVGKDFSFISLKSSCFNLCPQGRFCVPDDLPLGNEGLLLGLHEARLDKPISQLPLPGQLLQQPVTKLILY